MKKMVKFLLMGVTYFSFHIGNGNTQGICNQPSNPCKCDDQCYAKCSNANCPLQGSCASSCPAATVPFQARPGVVYSFSQGAYFVCPEGKEFVTVDDGYYACSSHPKFLLRKEIIKEKPIQVVQSNIYSFPAEILFKCAQPPFLINGPIPVNGLPSQYYFCPVRGEEGNPLKKQVK